MTDSKLARLAVDFITAATKGTEEMKNLFPPNRLKSLLNEAYWDFNENYTRYGSEKEEKILLQVFEGLFTNKRMIDQFQLVLERKGEQVDLDVWEEIFLSICKENDIEIPLIYFFQAISQVIKKIETLLQKKKKSTNNFKAINFAARWIAHKTLLKSDLQIMVDYVDKFIDAASWQETLLLAIRTLSNQQAKKILEYILSRDEKGIEQYFYHNHYFVMKFIARAGTWLDSREFVEKQMDDFFAFMQNRTYNKDDCFAFRENLEYYKSWDRFTKWVGTVTDSSIRLILINKLISVVEDKKQEGGLRLDCAVTLGNLGLKKKAVELLLSIAEDTTESDVDLHDCVWNLVEELDIKKKTVVNRILLLAEDSAQAVKDWSAYCSVLLELSYKKIYIRDTSVVDRMLSMAENTTKDESFRSSCARWVGDTGIKDKAVLDRLLALAKDTAQPDLLRRSCAETIGKLGNKEKALELLLATAEDGPKRWDDWWRWPEAIGDLGFKTKALELLLAMAEDTTQDFVLRADSAKVVGNMDVKDKSVALRLLALAEDTTQDDYVRSSCCTVVGNLGIKDKAIVNRLLTTAEDVTQENWVRACCAEAVGKLGFKKKALELLLAVAEDNTVESWIRSACAHSIVELGIKDKVAALRLLDAAEDTALNNSDRISFINAVEYLEIKDKKIAHRLMTLAEDTAQDIKFRHSCARAAWKAGEKYKAVNLLAELFLAQPDKSELGTTGFLIYDSLWELTDI